MEDLYESLIYQYLQEADPKEKMPADVPPTEDPTAGTDPTDMQGGEFGDPGMGDMGMGSDLGFPGEDQGPETKSQAGRIFELKKIHVRLASVEHYLGSAIDSDLIKLRSYVGKALELFNVVISNFDLYKDSIDEIIVMYYSYLDTVYSMISKYYKSKTNKGDK